MRFRGTQNHYASIDVLETSFLQTMVFISLKYYHFCIPPREPVFLNWCFGNSVSPDYGFCKSFSITVLASDPQNLCFNTCFGNSISPKHCFYKSFNCMLLNSFLQNLCFIQCFQKLASLNRYIQRCVRLLCWVSLLNLICFIMFLNVGSKVSEACVPQTQLKRMKNCYLVPKH